MELRELTLREYRPKSMLQVPEHPIEKPRFPVIDIHNHSEWRGRWLVADVPALVDAMDEAGVAARVDLDGGNGERLRKHMDTFRSRWPERFAIFASCEWDKHLDYDDFGERMARELRQSVAEGAEGLKVWKELGLTLRDDKGHLIAIDDERLTPLFQTAGECGIPVLIHSADPMAFFEPLNHENERYEELIDHPDWHFHGSEFPSFAELQRQLASLLARHPNITFIGAHVASLAENLSLVGQMFSRFPHLQVDIAARISELGRQPYTTADFLTRYSDRVLFGRDNCPAVADEYRVYYRFLETRDEYFPYWSNPNEEVGDSGRWMIYGVGLSDEVLKNIYHGNAVRILPRLNQAVSAMSRVL